VSGVLADVFGGGLGPGSWIVALHLRPVTTRPPGGGGRTGEARITVEATPSPQTDEDLAGAVLEPLL
jgi:hypothetical protein